MPQFKTVKLLQKEKYKEGKKKDGSDYVLYKYLGDDDETILMFDNLEVPKEYRLMGKEREYNGKIVIDWSWADRPKMTNPIFSKIESRLQRIEQMVKDIHDRIMINE